MCEDREGENMNKKGDVAMTMMFVAALILCVAALMVFMGSRREYGNIINENNKLVEMVHSDGQMLVYQESSIIMKISINSCAGCEVQNIKNLIKSNSIERKKLHPGAKTNLFSKIENGDFEIKKEGEGYEFAIKDVVFISERGMQSIRRRSSFKGYYDLNGELKRFIKE